MSSHLVTGAGSYIALALALATIVKALASVLRTRIEQASRTRRLAISLEGTKPHQRPGIIQACSQLEERSAGRPRSEEPDGPGLRRGIQHLNVIIRQPAGDYQPGQRG